ncbi:hypothetical protein BaRGS_00019996 [Batillaria attramentaria]|uniref:Uncharacterized protein n=1 Tax=Batillaria attramentaria TaxID=370345 RepID=A0ABD0KNC1_9CAEN
MVKVLFPHTSASALPASSRLSFVDEFQKSIPLKNVSMKRQPHEDAFTQTGSQLKTSTKMAAKPEVCLPNTSARDCA